MILGMVGLGRMGANMTRRLMKDGHSVVAYNRTFSKTEELSREGAIPSRSVEDLVSQLPKPRVVWLMLPSGQIIDEYISILTAILDKGDIIIEGGNSQYTDDIRRAHELEKYGIEFIDAGISGGIWGLERGYASMYGGKSNIFNYIEPIAVSLAPANGYLHCGDTGAGHYVKMIHNGIEYALMQAYAEGFQLLKASPYGDALDLSRVSTMWNNGSVISSWLLELLESIFADEGLDTIQGYVEDSGEARWAVKEAIDLGVAADTITCALYKRFNSRQEDVFADKVVAALRNSFGGHSLSKIHNNKVRTTSPGAGRVTHAKADDKQ